ncbi:DNA-binding transcriptional response regulator [Actinoplanes sandaracinus]|nr:hypothetical protein [Actinoplanes sandaracinus]
MVDDEATVRALLSDTLNLTEFTSSSAATGAEAVNLATRGPLT